MILESSGHLQKVVLSSNNSIQENIPGLKNYTRVINSAVFLGCSGLMDKACQILLSNGNAPNNGTTWQLL